MGQATIELPVDAEVARAYRFISDEEKARIAGLVSDLVKQTATTDRKSLTDLAREIGEEAQRNGMTEETLAEILRA